MSTHRHFILHKPFGYLSQFVNNQTRRKNKKLLGELFDFPTGTMAIGRLDQTSEGLLLLSTDGKVSEEVRSRKVEKEYYVQIDGQITEEAIVALNKSLELSNGKSKYQTLPSKTHKLESEPVFPVRTKKIRDDRHGPTSWISVTLKEGKFRQVRKMTASVGFPTLRLIRVRIGHIKLEGLNAGDTLEVDHFNLS